jgi:hypothetical protein
MRIPLSLTWWLFLLMCLEGASLLLDSFHHLIWGALGIFLLKSGYLVFAAILFIRFLSFRSQRVFETMVESYNRLSEKPWEPSDQMEMGFYKYLFYPALIALSLSNLISVFHWSEATFRASILLDTLIWLLALGWITRTHWLKARGLREKLKEFLDNARSRRRAGTNAEAGPGVGKRPFFMVAMISLAVALGVSVQRWRQAAVSFRVDDLKGCMEASFKETSDAFYQQGRLRKDVLETPCLADRREAIRAAQALREGEPYLKVSETESSDYFGDGIEGDEGLELGTAGGFRKIPAR